jgi:ABC-type nitrate/sulfonate/bicarbonate transport system substrate-binding protein
VAGAPLRFRTGEDVKIIVTGESPTRLAALRAGAIDATPIDVAFAVKAEDEGFKRLVYLGDLIELPLSGIAVMDQKLRPSAIKLSESSRRVRGLRFMKQNRNETVQMLSDYLRITPSQSAEPTTRRSIPSPTTALFPTKACSSTYSSPRSGSS